VHEAALLVAPQYGTPPIDGSSPRSALMALDDSWYRGRQVGRQRAHGTRRRRTVARREQLILRDEAKQVGNRGRPRRASRAAVDARPRPAVASAALGVADDALEAAVHNACVRESGSCVNGRMHATHAGRLGDRCVRIQGCRRRCHRQQHPRGMLAQLRRVHDARLCTRQLRAS